MPSLVDPLRMTVNRTRQLTAAVEPLTNAFFWHRLRCFFAFVLLFSHPHPTHCSPLPQQPSALSTPLTITTSYGTVTGLDLGNGVARFTLPFAHPPVGDLRFASPKPIQAFSDAGDAVKVTDLPPQCYQYVGVRGGNDASEDCLYITYYAPIAALEQVTSSLPIMVWFHGGSGIAGGASQDGLDGSMLAKQQNVIVAVPQYRLSLFGWLQTDQSFDEKSGGQGGSATLAGNQAMRDAIMALQMTNSLARQLHGDPARVTVMGQSSGATMVRSLLNVQSAQSWFNNVVLVSDPNLYGFSSIADNNALGNAAMDALGCDYGDIACARSASADDVLQATYTAFSNVPYDNPRISAGTPWRPMVGDLISGSPIASSSKSIMMTTVQNELGSVAGANFASSAIGDLTTLMLVSGDNQYPMAYVQALGQIFNGDRGDVLGNATQVYAINATLVDALRQMYEEIGTDGVWRCSTQYRATVALPQQLPSSKVYLAEWQIGSTYSSNAQNSYCTSDGRVCHEDDIHMIFGTMAAGSASNAQTAASKEIQTRLANFAKKGAPMGPKGTAKWLPVQSKDNVNLLTIQPSGSTLIAPTQHQPACGGTLWGQSVQFDWQLYPSP